MEELKNYWFQKAKIIRLGKPIVWQGWAVYISYGILVLLPLLFRPYLGGKATIIQISNQVFWTVILIVIAVKKGRPYQKAEETAEPSEVKYWFPKKELYDGMSMGWGFPDTWQGTVLVLAFVLGLHIPLIIRPFLGKFFALFIVGNSIFWIVFFVTMLFKHGEK